MRSWRQGEDLYPPLNTRDEERWKRIYDKECSMRTEKCFIYLDGQKSSSPAVFGSDIFGWDGYVIKVLKDCCTHANKPAHRLWNRNTDLQTSTNDSQGRDDAVIVGLHARTANEHKHGRASLCSSGFYRTSFLNLCLTLTHIWQSCQRGSCGSLLFLFGSGSLNAVVLTLRLVDVCVRGFPASVLFVRGQSSALNTLK